MRPPVTIITKAIRTLARVLPDILYHYTSTDGLVGILTSRSLWATDIEFLNDAEELTHASSELLRKIEVKVESLGGQVAEDDPGHPGHSQVLSLQQLCSYVRSIQRLESDERAYVTCFCEDGDLLSQWRSYAGPGGYALGFDPHLLDPTISDVTFSPILTWIRYGVDAASSSLEHMVSELAPRKNNHPGVEAWHQQILVLRLLASIKNPGFAEEREWRTMITSHQVRSRYGAAAFAPQDAAVDLQFRTGPLGITPYVSRAFPSQALVSVTIGPGGDRKLRERAVRELLRETMGSKAGDIVVNMSQVPLR